MVHLHLKSESSGLVFLTLVTSVSSVVCTSAAKHGPDRLTELDTLSQTWRLQRARRSSFQRTSVPHFHTNTRLPRQQLGGANPLDPFGFLTSTFEDDLTDTITSTAHAQHTPTSATSVMTKTGTMSLTLTTSVPLGASSSAGTIGSSPASIPNTASLLPTTTSPAPSPSTSPEETSASSDPGPDSWKIIGIGVLAFTAIAVIILSVTFFDTWWSTFLRPMLFGKGKNKIAKEQLIPDWERRSWRIGIEEKDDRYPSVASLPSVLRMGGGRDGKGGAAVMPEHRTREDDESEKSPCVDKDRNLAFPLPPKATKAPFPLYRQLSTGSRLPTTATTVASATAVPSPSPTLGRNNSLKTPERAYARSPERAAGRNPLANSGSAPPGSTSAPVTPRKKASLKRGADSEKGGESLDDYYYVEKDMSN